MSASLQQFAQLCQELAATSKKLGKRSLIADYLKPLAIKDISRAALYLSGQPFAETDRRTLNVGGSLLSKAVSQLSGADRDAMYAAYHKNGDLGAAAYDLLANRQPMSPTLSLEDVEAALDEIAAAKGPTAKQRLVLDLFTKATPLEAKYLIKLITGDMRIGVKQSLVEEAIAFAYGVEPSQVRHALGLETGDRVEFVEQEKGQFVIIPATRSIQELKGLFQGKRSKPVSIEEMNAAIAKRASGSR